jgi:hypothetical protein
MVSKKIGKVQGYKVRMGFLAPRVYAKTNSAVRRGDPLGQPLMGENNQIREEKMSISDGTDEGPLSNVCACATLGLVKKQ